MEPYTYRPPGSACSASGEVRTPAAAAAAPEFSSNSEAGGLCEATGSGTATTRAAAANNDPDTFCRSGLLTLGTVRPMARARRRRRSLEKEEDVLMRRIQLIAVTLAGLGLAGQAHAVDGVQEINAACVPVGCFPGDTPGYPVQLSAAGGKSYRLTSDLSFSLAEANVDAIVIAADEVRLDLNGFNIRGPGAGGGTGRGIVASSPTGALSENPTIVNGTIFGMRGRGIDLEQAPGVRLEGLILRDNAGGGAFVGPRSTVVGSRFEDNGSVGLSAFDQVDVTVRNNVFEGHTQTAIEAGSYARIEGNHVDGTGPATNGRGILAGGYSHIIDNIVLQATGNGISAGGGSSVEGNTVQGALGLYGIICTASCRVVGNTVLDSNATGIDVGSRSLAQGNVIHDNGTIGLTLNIDSIFIGNVITDNGTNQVQIGTSSNGGQNLCSGPGTVTASCP